jgi:hypothetical protein
LGFLREHCNLFAMILGEAEDKRPELFETKKASFQVAWSKP